MKLSILIATITERVYTHLPNLIRRMRMQIGDRQDIEIVGFLDNRMRTVGEKRQDLLNLSRGEYIVFFDDDDDLADDYISSIMGAGEDNPGVDSVSFAVLYTNAKTGKDMICIYDKDFEGRKVGADGIWRGPPAHIHVSRAEIAKSVPWLERPPAGGAWSLDAIWADAVAAKIKTQVIINHVLYYYNFDPNVSETLKRNRKIQGR